MAPEPRVDFVRHKNIELSNRERPLSLSPSNFIYVQIYYIWELIVEEDIAKLIYKEIENHKKDKQKNNDLLFFFSNRNWVKNSIVLKVTYYILTK